MNTIKDLFSKEEHESSSAAKKMRGHMNTIKDLFSKAIDRWIEEVNKVDQADESTVLEEL